jgi:hypothetical protein
MPRPPVITAAILVLAVLWAAGPAQAQPPGLLPVGRIKHVEGSAFIVRGGQPLPATVGADVAEADFLRTGPDGTVAVILKDETRVSIGPNTELGLTQFAYAPAEGRLAMVLRLLHGAMSYVSGRIAKLNPDAVRLETPSSVIGVRGTHALVKVGRS